MSVERVDVAIVGGGPAGLTAARALADAGVGRVVVLDRETVAGGIPRHSDHIGYGVRDLHRVLRGPEYARRLVASAAAAGAEVRTETTVTGWSGELALDLTSPRGRTRLEASAIVLATGARERPRSARLVPGDRPDGVLTTGQLQQMVHLQHRSVGERAVIVGAELVSWSAALTLREAGCRVALMTSEHERAEAYAPVRAGGRALLRVPVATTTTITRIIGRDRVRAVEVLDLRTGERREVACDVVVFTGNWVAEGELARSAGLDVDPTHRGPVVDTALRTSRPGVFAAGNVCHPVDTADVAAIDGEAVATSVRRWLHGEQAPVEHLRLHVAAPLTWVAPAVVRAGDPAPPRGRLLLWSSTASLRPRLHVEQEGRLVVDRRLPWPMSPGRALRIPWSYLAPVDPHSGDATLHTS